MGRIKKYKSVNHLILAFAEVKKTIPEAELILIGDGDYLPEIKRLTTKLNLNQSVTLTGATHHQSKIDYLNKMWFLVNPSPKEGWGLTNIEANSTGTAVVAANSPGLRDSVKDNVTGFLYEYGNINLLAEKILSILKDNDLRIRLEQGGLKWAETFNWDNAADKFNKLLNEIVEPGK